MHQEKMTGKTNIYLWVKDNVLFIVQPEQKKKTFKNKALKSPRGRQNLFIYLQAVSPSQTLKSVEAGSLAKNNVYSCRRLMVRQMG